MTSMPPNRLRFLFPALMLLATAVFLQARSRTEVLPLRQGLAAFPYQLGEWTGQEIPIEKNVLDVLGPGDFLLRAYRSASARQQPYVGLFMAYFSSQRAGDTIHSPRNCLPGAGWSPVRFTRIQITVSGQAPIKVNRYIVSKGDDRQLVLYWYLAHNRTLASEYWAKFYLVADSIRLNRSDGSLIRLSTPIAAGETADIAQERLVALASQVVPQLSDYIPR